MDEYSAECERKPATEITVRPYFGDREGTGQAGQTRQAGIVATGRTNERAAEQATFKGREILRKASNR